MKRPLLYLIAMLCVAASAHADQTIRSLQQTLKQQGFYYGTVTGDKNAETTAAIRRYQIRNGLKVTGEINDETMSSHRLELEFSCRGIPIRFKTCRPSARERSSRCELKRYSNFASAVVRPNQVSRPLHRSTRCPGD